MHTLYNSPLKALTIDVHRNLTSPIEDQGLDIRVETRTGDTSAYKKNRQKVLPPDMLMTTPESLALLLSNKESKDYFKDLRYLVIDEIHVLVNSKEVIYFHLIYLELFNESRLQKNRFVCDCKK